MARMCVLRFPLLLTGDPAVAQWMAQVAAGFVECHFSLDDLQARPRGALFCHRRHLLFLFSFLFSHFQPLSPLATRTKPLSPSHTNKTTLSCAVHGLNSSQMNDYFWQQMGTQVFPALNKTIQVFSSTFARQSRR
jgi:hypothetical protein